MKHKLSDILQVYVEDAIKKPISGLVILVSTPESNEKKITEAYCDLYEMHSIMKRELDPRLMIPDTGETPGYYVQMTYTLQGKPVQIQYADTKGDGMIVCTQSDWDGRPAFKQDQKFEGILAIADAVKAQNSLFMSSEKPSE